VGTGAGKIIKASSLTNFRFQSLRYSFSSSHHTIFRALALELVKSLAASVVELSKLAKVLRKG